MTQTSSAPHTHACPMGTTMAEHPKVPQSSPGEDLGQQV